MFLHQTTTSQTPIPIHPWCFLYCFYIKPQLAMAVLTCIRGVSYIVSTSNHNFNQFCAEIDPGVSYIVSTSNHNSTRARAGWRHGVSYIVSTSNHNMQLRIVVPHTVFLILFLHQTTTCRRRETGHSGCFLYCFYIKPQHFLNFIRPVVRCFLYCFYIKPQLKTSIVGIVKRCFLYCFYIKPQPSLL